MKNVVIIDDVGSTVAWIASPRLERLESQERLGFGCPYFDLTPLTASNGKHFPFVNQPEQKLMSRIVEEIRQYLSEITEENYRTIISMVRNKVPDNELLLYYATLTANKFGKCHVDRAFLKNIQCLPSIADIYDDGERTLNGHLRIAKAKEKVVDRIGDDYVKIHNAVASLLGVEMIKKTVRQKDKDIMRIIAENAPLKYSIRVAREEVQIDGKKIAPGTVLLFDIARASRETGDTRFVFGQGTNDRRCPFGFFMEEFLKNLRKHCNHADARDQSTAGM